MTTESQGVVIFADSLRSAQLRHDTLRLRWSTGCRARIDEKGEVPAQPVGAERAALDVDVGGLAVPQRGAGAGGAGSGIAGAPARASRLEQRGDESEHLGRLRLARRRRGVDSFSRVEAVADRAHP